MINSYYTVDDKGWKSPNLSLLTTPSQCDIVIKEFNYNYNIERVKSLAFQIVGWSTAALSVNLIISTAKIVGFALSIFALPLILIPPLYGAVVFGTWALFCIVLGGAAYNHVINPLFRQALEHTQYANHLKDGGIYLQLHKTQLMHNG